MPLKPYQYKYIFFDLDHTLWDFEKCSEETLSDLFKKYELEKLGLFTEDGFKQQFQQVNSHLWTQSDEGKIDRDTLRSLRFKMVCEGLGMSDPEIASRMGEEYVSLCPQKNFLLPYALDVLEHLHKKYPMYILTNGFSDVQAVKMKAAGILPFFRQIFTGDNFGVGKPHKQFFTGTMKEIGARPSECLMIGDNLKTDILGAQNAGIDHVFYNPHKRNYFMEVQHEIHCLSELLKLL
jgi:putative hydrolase of the HAD superfamily